MRTQHHLGAPTSQKLYRRNRSMDTAVIGDSRRTGFERHVQICAQQYPLAAQLNILDYWQSGGEGDFLQIMTGYDEDLIQLPNIANVTSQFHQFRDIPIFESSIGEGLFGFAKMLMNLFEIELSTACFNRHLNQVNYD